VRGCEVGSGCICWRCFTGCKIELPSHIMAPIWASEWQRLITQKRYWDREESTWDNNAAMDREEDAYDEEDFAHLMIFDANAGTHVLTISPEMGLTHQHTGGVPSWRPLRRGSHHFHGVLRGVDAIRRRGGALGGACHRGTTSHLGGGYRLPGTRTGAEPKTKEEEQRQAGS
jgi:hypothetical protein